MRDFVQESYELLKENEWTPTLDGMSKIIDAWGRNKQALIDVLSKSPNWVEEDKMIRFSNDFSRELDRSAIYRFVHWIRNHYDFSEWNESPSRRMVISMINELNTTLTEDNATVLNNFDETLRATAGQKSSRAINKLLTKLELNKDPDYNKEFAKFSDAINPLTVSRHTCLSVNPIDFLNMSNGNSWTSCHRVFEDDGEYGCYCSGTVSYMTDESTFVFYTVDSNYDGDDISTAPKLNRQVFNYQHGKLVQGRLYPQSCDCGCKDSYTEIRNLVQKIIADCLEQPNMWIKSTNVRDNVNTVSGSTHYADYFHFSNCSVSKLKDNLDDAPVLIGQMPTCIECGRDHSYENSLSCCSSAPSCGYVCEDCGSHMDEDDAVWVESEQGWFCGECVAYCDICGEYHREYEVRYVESADRYVCDECLDDGFIRCEDCGEWVPTEDSTYIGGEDYSVCSNCYSESYGYCEECCENFKLEELTEIDDKHLCDNCIEENYSKCEHCGAWTDNLIETANGGVCEDCLENYFTECSSCEKMISDADILEHEDCLMCEECYNNAIEDEADTENEVSEEEMGDITNV